MEDITVTMQELFRFDVSSIGIDGRIVGRLVPTGIMPTFGERFAKAGVALDSIIPAMGGKWA